MDKRLYQKLILEEPAPPPTFFSGGVFVSGGSFASRLRRAVRGAAIGRANI